MKFIYTGFDANGKSRRGVMEAATEQAAREKLRADGVLVLELGEADRVDDERVRGPKGKLGEITQCLRHLSVLLASGTQLSEAVDSLASQARNPKFAAVLEDIRDHIESGSALSEAMAKHPGYFDRVCRAMISAGEDSGRMSELLDRVARMLQQQLRVQRTLVASMIYPVLLIGIGLVVVVSMLVFVFPRFEELFDSLDTPIPPSTQLFMTISYVLRNYWWAVVPSVLGVGALGWLATRRPSTGRLIGGAMLRTPKIGPLLQAFANARVARMFALLLDSHLPLLDVLELSSRSMRSPEYVDLLRSARDAAESGQPISSVFDGSDLVHPLVREGVRTGERTGSIGRMMNNVAEFLEEENDAALKTLTSIIEPLLLVTLGLIVGTIAISMFLPLFDLTATAGAP